MISLGGLGTFTGLRLSDATRDKAEVRLRSEPQNARQIKAFEERIASIRTPKDLIADTEVYTFVMRAFDLEDRIFGKAMVRKILESDPNERDSLVNRLTDPRFRELNKVMGFTPNGGPSENVSDPAWRAGIVERFANQVYINGAGEGNEGVGLALKFRDKAAGINSWFDVLKDPELGTFMRTALGMPDEMIRLDIDRQAAAFGAKFDIEKLKDPAEVETLVRRFAAIHDARNGTFAYTPASGALQLLQGGGFNGAVLRIEEIALR